MPDSRTFIWLKWKILSNQALYWLRLLGFETDKPWAYLFYVLGFWIFWLFSMWAYLLEQVFKASKFIPLELQAQMRYSIPVAILLIQVIYLVYSLFNDSYKLTAPDINYIVSSPGSRGMIALTNFWVSALIPAVIFALGNCLIEMMLNWHDMPELVGIIGLKAVILGVLLVYFTMAIGWVISSLKRADIKWVTKLELFLAALVLFVLPIPLNMSMSLTMPAFAVLIIALLLMLPLVMWIGQRVHLSDVADRSQTYARIQRLGLMGRFYARAVLDRIHRQSRLVKKRELRFNLGNSTSPLNTLLQRSILSLLRLSPRQILTLLGRGIFMTAMVTFLFMSMGWQAFQVWLIIAFQFVLICPSELIGSFGQETSQSFLSQFMPSDKLFVYFTAAVIPVFIASWGGSIVILLVPNIDKLAGIALVILTANALALCLAMELKKFSVAYEYTVLAYGVLIAATAFFTGSLLGVIYAAFFFNMIMAWIVADS